MLSRETQALMDAAVDAIVVVDHLGRISAVNGATRRIFGYADDELVGANVSKLMPEPERDDQRMAGVLFRRKDGSRQSFGVIGAACAEADAVAIAVLARQPQPWRAPPLTGTAGGK